jgi:hypothetical protein
LTLDTLCKVLNYDGTPHHGGSGAWALPSLRADGTWRPGTWLTVKPPLIPCQRGLHVCTIRQVPEWVGPALFTVEVSGLRLDARDKIVVQWARLLARVENWNDRTLRLWACDCAERALDRASVDDPRSRNALAVARAYANGEATAEQLAAAWNAARAAASAAASAAARAAARNAARDAAWDAASAAARAAECEWQQERLLAYINGTAAIGGDA